MDPKVVRFAVAPMMDWTDRHCRFFHRVLSRRARLYTEMVTTGAVIHGDRARLLGFSPQEQPVAVQLGGSDPAALAQTARIAEDFGYAEVNLNVGCPSDRVQGGRFGACLMREPGLVGDCIAAMKAAVRVPVTVKCRIGVDDQDPEAALDTLADHAVLASAADAIIVHARKAWLNGLSPRENRDVPPLDYGRVHRLKARLPAVPIMLNGGLTSLAQCVDELAGVDGVTLGRAAYRDPEILLGVDPMLFGAPPPVTDAFEAIRAVRSPDVAARLAEGVPLHAMTRHLLGLFQARRRQPGPGDAISRPRASSAARGLSVLREALAPVERERAPGACRDAVLSRLRFPAFSRMSVIRCRVSAGLAALSCRDRTLLLSDRPLPRQSLPSGAICAHRGDGGDQAGVFQGRDVSRYRRGRTDRVGHRIADFRRADRAARRRLWRGRGEPSSCRFSTSFFVSCMCRRTCECRWRSGHRWP
jgi:tRNA-dihydrouridine synthase A